MLEKSEFQKEMTLTLYIKIAKILTMINNYPDTLEIEENTEADLMEFYKKYKRNFYNKNNTNCPKFELRTINGKFERFHDGIPKIHVNIYHRPTKTTSTKILIPLEKVIFNIYFVSCLR